MRRTISLLKPAGFDLVAVCHQGRLREALFSSMSAPKRLRDVYTTRQLRAGDTVPLEAPDDEALEDYSIWDFALLMTYSVILVACTTVVLKVL